MVESQGKVSEKSGNFEMDIECQPCIDISDLPNNPFVYTQEIY